MPLKIYVDGDACPVKAEVERVATRHQLPVVIVSNGGLRPNPNPLIENVTVAEGADAADNWIADHIEANDICITADIPLASRCLEKKARVLGPTGRPFDEASIGMALATRALKQHLRELTPGGQSFNAGFTKQDRSKFLDSLEREIQAVKRLQR